MSRLRSSLSTNPVDRAIADKLRSAERLISEALKLCDPKGHDVIKQRRARATRRDLMRIVAAINSVRRIESLYEEPKLQEAGKQKALEPELPVDMDESVETPPDEPIEVEEVGD